jgi:hypothetical protein
MDTRISEEHKRRLLRLIAEADSIEALRWCREELDRCIAGLCAEKARCIHDGDAVEVTDGPLAGTCGTVIAHGCRTGDTLLVELDGLEFDLPLPIPSWALRVRTAAAVPA